MSARYELVKTGTDEHAQNRIIGPDGDVVLTNPVRRNVCVSIILLASMLNEALEAGMRDSGRSGYEPTTTDRAIVARVAADVGDLPAGRSIQQSYLGTLHHDRRQIERSIAMREAILDALVKRGAAAG